MGNAYPQKYNFWRQKTASGRSMLTIFGIVLASLLASCEPPVEKPPANLIPTSTMKDIIMDMHLAEAHVDIYYQEKGKDTARMAFQSLEAKIYDKYEVSEETYKTSYNYYLRNTEELDKIYEQVVREFSKMESRAKAGKQKKK